MARSTKIQCNFIIKSTKCQYMPVKRACNDTVVNSQRYSICAKIQTESVLRRKRIEIREILRQLCQWKGVEIIEWKEKYMTRYPCAICHKRACDSCKTLALADLSQSNRGDADVIIKCHNCRNAPAVKVIRSATRLPTGKYISEKRSFHNFPYFVHRAMFNIRA